MQDWMVEAGILRLRKALEEATDAERREAITAQLRAAQAKLSSNRMVDAPAPDHAKVKKADRFGGKGLWERKRP